MSSIKNPKQKFFATEVIQTSGMDCGPASLKCLMDGFGLNVSYGRLREACQTDVDGTSIDTMEQIAVQLGLNAEQIMLPVDHINIPEANALPAIAVTLLPNGATHFVVLWRRMGSYIQIMDPATGRRWVKTDDMLSRLYQHRMPVPAQAWLDWVRSDEFTGPLKRRMQNIGIQESSAKANIETVLGKQDWLPIAALDAALRMVTALVKSKGIDQGKPAEKLCRYLAEAGVNDPSVIPENYWMVKTLPPEPEQPEQLLLKGAVIVRVLGPKISPAEEPRQHNDQKSDQQSETPEQILSPELEAALKEPPARPGHALFSLIKKDGLLSPVAVTLALLVASFAVIVEALLLRGMLDIGLDLETMDQRIAAMTALILFVAALLIIELPIMASVFRIGRHLEARLRMAFMEKIPRLGDQYFHSRPVSDMAERSHSMHLIRELSQLGEHFIRSLFILVFTTLGIIWLDPETAYLAVTIAALAIAIPLLMQPVLSEQELKVRSHNGALGRYYLDSLIGLVAIKTHSAENAIQREHESLAVEWCRASYRLLTTVVTAEGIQGIIGFGLAAWLLLDHLSRTQEMGAVLLLAYWALNLPVLGQEIVLVARQYPTLRNRTLRLLEPLTAPEQAQEENHDSLVVDSESGPVSIRFEEVYVQAGGHPILHNINLDIAAGSHVAIVGRSGAGKSSLIGLLLGWHRPVHGKVKVNGSTLHPGNIQRLREHLAWVDPTVQLWNRSLLDNLRYGNQASSDSEFAHVIQQADLVSVLQKLPEGLQTQLGESGGLVSGGEGQRVRLGRAMLRTHAKLVILDEPFRGLDRQQRRRLLQQARELWRDATLICVTHDIEETREFDQVYIIEQGHLVEQGAPDTVSSKDESIYSQLLAAEQEVRHNTWTGQKWKQWYLRDGRLVEE